MEVKKLFFHISPFPLKFRHNKPTYTFCPFKISCISNSLETHSSTIPFARSGHRIVVDDRGNIYSFGGYSTATDVLPEERGDFIWVEDCLLFKELWKFNIATKTWTKLRTFGSMPEELASHSAVYLDNQLLIFGGTSMPFGESMSNSVHLCDLKTLTWRKLKSSGDPPSKQYGQAIVVDKNMLYTVGGTTGYDFSMDIHALNLNTGIWAEMNTLAKPQPRYRHEVVLDDDRVLVFGGGTRNESFSLKEIPFFNLREKCWQIEKTSFAHPRARRCHGCVRLDNDVYISGGQAPGRIFADIWAIDLKSMAWRRLPCFLPLPVYFHSSAISKEGQMFIFGGVTSLENNTRTNKLFSMWVKIPSLAEICWQAFLFYVPQIEDYNKYDLLEAGVPMEYANRVDFRS